MYNYKTGEILCAVTSPSYDPDHVPDVANDTTGSYDGVYVNRFFDAAYTPGSIFKLVTAAAALETDRRMCRSRTFTSAAAKPSSAGRRSSATACTERLSLAGALAHSCNVAFGELAAELGAGVLQEYAEKLGLTGSISCEGYKTAPGKIDLSGADDGDVAWAGIGQYTDQVGALAFLRYMGAIANGGNAAEPYLMQRVRKGDDITYEAEAKLTSAMIQPETAGTLTKLMRNDVQTIYGDWQFGGLSRLRQIRHGRARGADGKRDVRGLCAGCILSGGVRGVRGKRRRGKHGRGAYGGKGAWRLRAGAAIGIKSKDAAQPRFSCVGGAFVV